MENRRPPEYMFIDSSTGGVNAKPDKVVRSFVMKSARRKKSWSTKPIRSTAESSTKRTTRRQPPSHTRPEHKKERGSRGSPPPGSETALVSRDQQIAPSPGPTGSRRSNSVVSSHGSNEWAYRYESPVFNNASPRASHHGPGVSCGTEQQLAVPHRFDAFLGSFDCLAISLDGHTRGLLHRWVELSSPCLLPIDPHQSSRALSTQWMSTCLQSPIGASYILAALTSSTRLAGINSDNYKWRSIAAINEVLTSMKRGVDDTTISSVLILLALEEVDLTDPRLKGEARMYSAKVNEAHICGLRNMVEQRGGLGALSTSRCLQAFILMHSISQSITTFRRPYTVLYDSSGRIEDYVSATSTNPTPATNRIEQHYHDLGVHQSLLEIIHTATIFVTDIITWFDTGTCTVNDAFELQKHASLLLYRLFDWYDRSSQDDAHAMNQSVCLALMIFMTHVAEPHTLSFGSRFLKVVQRLRSDLQRSPPVEWSNAPDVFLWTLTMGALAANGLSKAVQSSNSHSLMHFFTQRLRVASKILDVDMATATHVLNRLRTCLWVSSVFDNQVTKLWEDARLCNAAVHEIDELSTSSEGDRDQLIDVEYALGQSTATRFFSADKIGTQRVVEVVEEVEASEDAGSASCTV